MPPAIIRVRELDAAPTPHAWVDGVHEALRPQALVFSQNLLSTHAVLQLPASLNMAKALDLAMRDQPDGGPDRWWSIVSADRSCDELEAVAEANEYLREAATELLMQGTVSAWSAFEILAQDSFATALNARPSLADMLMRTEDGRSFFANAKTIKIDALAEYGFDLSSRMGDVLLEARSIDNVKAMKTVFRALMPTATPLLAALGERELLILNKTRNLIVHRRGVVDDELAKLVPEAPVGSKLVMSARGVDNALSLVTRIGMLLLGVLGAHIDPADVRHSSLA